METGDAPEKESNYGEPVNPTVRGLVIFASVLITVLFWMPLSNSPRMGPAGGTITETYFGVFRYATMHAVMKEPDFKMSWSVDPKRLAVTATVTILFWCLVVWILKRGGKLTADRAKT
jgi:UDP-N-acetylmuramyl pentapeptide phosphotransferase/UDP-N-acetylglucosamine-1-phosphate transferase